jgi:hypothetical protein
VRGQCLHCCTRDGAILHSTHCRVRNGKRTVTDGPPVHGEEFLTGYFLIEAESFEAAIEWATKIPNARTGSVEVRRVDEGELADRMAAAARLPGKFPAALSQAFRLAPDRGANVKACRRRNGSARSMHS